MVFHFFKVCLIIQSYFWMDLKYAIRHFLDLKYFIRFSKHQIFEEVKAKDQKLSTVLTDFILEDLTNLINSLFPTSWPVDLILPRVLITNNMKKRKINVIFTWIFPILEWSKWWFGNLFLAGKSIKGTDPTTIYYIISKCYQRLFAFALFSLSSEDI